MRRLSYILMMMPLFLLSTGAEDKPLSFDEQSAWRLIKDMATDSMQGRRSGQPGAFMAEEYIAAKFREWGLEPAGDDGTFFQNFTIEHRHIGQGAEFQIWTDRLHRGFDYREDWRVQSYSGSGRFVAEVVFAGYGIHAPDLEYSDYADVDVKGKIVMLTTGVPTRLMKKIDEAGEMENRIREARERGALGVIGFLKPRSESRYFSMRLPKESYHPDFVILSVEEHVSNFIFKDLATDLRYLFQEIDRTGKSQSFATGIKVFVSIESVFDPERKTRNVLAKITGSDRALREESVVIGGHMDHLGISPDGDVYNGANDNASGTAVAMEIARVMRLNREKPKRTVVFAAWAGEEQGLLGSRWYCDHPPLPIEKTVTYINMDMVGHGTGKVPFRGVYYGPRVWDTIKPALPEDILEYVKPGRGGPGGSDHTPFLSKGIPAYAVMTEGYHFKYHRTRDDIDLIKPEILKKVGDFVLAATRIMADAEGDFIVPRRQERYHFRYQHLTNYKTVPLARIIDHRKDVEDPSVDLQLTLLEEKEGLTGDALRIDLIRQLFTAADAVKKAKNLWLFTSSDRLSIAERASKTTLMPGLAGISAFKDEARWAGVLAGQGLYFVRLDDPAGLFDGETLSGEGRALLKGITEAGLVLMLGGLDDVRAEAVLEACRKPLILLCEAPPSEKILELIKEKDAAVGLILSEGGDIGEYFQGMEQIREAIGSRHLQIVNRSCLWKDEGKARMLDLLGRIIEADYGRSDFADVFSRTFMRVLNAVRGDG